MSIIRPDTLLRLPELFDLLAGHWTFVRDIPGQATMEGHARFTPTGPDTLAYEEEASVRMAQGGTHRARQRYVYVRAPRGFEVWFAEDPPRRFHAIELHRDGDHWIGEATHECGSDRYDSRYRFELDGRSFELRHVVSGPRKAYTSTTGFKAVAREDQPFARS